MKTKLLLLFLTISLFSFAQNGDKSIDKTMDEIITPNDSYFEVTRDMFKMLSESKEANPEFTEYIKKLHSLKMIEPGLVSDNHGIVLVNKFLENANLQRFSLLMTRKERNDIMSFYKKEGKSENEFLLLSSEMIIYITGTIDLKSIHEFQRVMEIAGGAMGM